MRFAARRAWPLRHRLLMALVGSCAAGLAVFAVAGVLLLDRSLLSRVDVQLAEIAATLGHRPPPPPPPEEGRDPELPTQFRISLYGPTGVMLREMPAAVDDGPVVPARVIAVPPPGPVTLPGRGENAPEWRVRVVALPEGGRAAVSMSLESNRETVRQMLVIEVAAGLLVLVLLGGVARMLVRVGLRPLTRMEATACVIAGGAIDRRVEDDDPRTETGRLGRALNTMLERLARALRERERSERRLRRFVADASHELRTPLTSIRGFAQLYRHGQAPRDPAAERMLRRIESEAERMGVLVEDMLLLARLDQEPTLERSEVDLRVLAGDVVHAARATDRDRSVHLVVSGEPVCVLGDEHRLHQVIANLVGNALRHTVAGTPVRVEVGRRAVAGPPGADVAHVGAGPDPGAEAALIEVRDDGQGIEPGHLPHVFDRFYRADPSRSRGHGGTGLGLAIAAALVQAHGGRIEVVSAPGQGTAFLVLLPLARPFRLD
ncbi:HAMP domain-containing sensor histidine kinase [Sphaerisporangium siamense]|uniref:histidine kinase n=1 Tax=Sphaerisporangium siamense TaxID=795645 RepID=A0A7W7D3H7_9ACTN|nr:HAMP domain-containing sensor histidine kinase [Sphaerisporangium siamense]MBB4699507.1 two-component system OmpR family sensor kinase [Sphaerisporangium siamense]